LRVQQRSETSLLGNSGEIERGGGGGGGFGGRDERGDSKGEKLGLPPGKRCEARKVRKKGQQGVRMGNKRVHQFFGAEKTRAGEKKKEKRSKNGDVRWHINEEVPNNIGTEEKIGCARKRRGFINTTWWSPRRRLLPTHSRASQHSLTVKMKKKGTIHVTRHQGKEVLLLKPAMKLKSTERRKGHRDTIARTQPA